MPITDKVSNLMLDLSSNFIIIFPTFKNFISYKKENMMDKVLSGEMPPDPGLLNLTSLALTAKIRS